MSKFPEFSWSYSRHSCFEDCQLKYYYHYYLSHGGWLFNSATPESAAAYRLKQITNLYLVFGESLHKAAEKLIERISRKQSLPDSDAVQRVIRNDLNRAYAESLDPQRWQQQPKQRIMLHELYYEGALSEKAISTMTERRKACADRLLASKTLQELLHEERAEILEVEKLNTQLIHETKTYVKMDLLYRLGDQYVIADWKTGKENQGHEIQLLQYASYVSEHYGVPAENIVIRLEYLLGGNHEEMYVEAGFEEKMNDFIGESLHWMKAKLDDDYFNKAKPMEHFESARSPFLCKSCNFKQICNRSLAVS
ncbi:PD-(D/E)XK nuclease family protein [Paenibacillus antri]|uniref:PD-(D/E)XK nuclease family protein n=1 Tax=Paenibacillus antri TaxID=2582848 RepID=A0A5R9GL38_9BACL|nr:PD-(D/E)XK nuclease family protein [Paenibacillus antri]TLS53783.1 PD-(D/E)XK nuclease family protein [Paenibacillus antri]